MLKKLLLVAACLTIACLVERGVTVEAQAQCETYQALFMEELEEVNTSQTACYEVYSDLSALKIMLDIKVTSGNVNVYWAAGVVSEIKKRTNAQENFNGFKRFVFAIDHELEPDPDIHTLIIAPAEESAFLFLLTEYTPDSPGRLDAPNPCISGLCDGGIPENPFDLDDLPLEGHPGLSITLPIAAVCLSELETYVDWEGDAALELRLENEHGTVMSVQGKVFLHMVYNTQPEEQTSENIWQWILVNTNGGKVNELYFDPYFITTSCSDTTPVSPTHISASTRSFYPESQPPQLMLGEYGRVALAV